MSYIHGDGAPVTSVSPELLLRRILAKILPALAVVGRQVLHIPTSMLL